MGTVLKTMRQRGELAERGKRNMSQRATFILEDLGLTGASPHATNKRRGCPKTFTKNGCGRSWPATTGCSPPPACGLARRQDDACLPLAASRLRRLVVKLAKRMSDDDRERLPRLLTSLARQLKGATVQEETLGLRIAQVADGKQPTVAPAPDLK